MYISPIFLQLNALVWIKRLLDVGFLFCAFYLITDLLHFFVAIGVIVVYFLVGLLTAILHSHMEQEAAREAYEEWVKAADEMANAEQAPQENRDDQN